MRWYEWLLLVILTLIPLIGGFIGARSFNTGKYKNNEFDKPDWAPPSWAFSPIWSAVYLMMGFASFLVWKLGGGLHFQTLPPLLLYVLQLLLNWTWTPSFFGFGNFCAALMIISMLTTLVFACIVTFTPVSKVAALLLVPYLGWLGFAVALNYSIVCLNGCLLEHNSTAINTTGII